MTIRVGVLGLSEGNGHPFSFSAIINGFADADMSASGWPVIHSYLRQRDPSEFGGLGLEVTHAWTQDTAITDRLCRACHIPHAADRPDAMVGSVDAIILARDDYPNHLEMALPFLEAGLPVLVDKPLTVEPRELTILRPYLESGQLISCSGMRFARELDAPRSHWEEYGEIRLIRGAILNDWEKYGIHLIDAILNITTARPVSVTPLPCHHQSVAVCMNDSSLVQLDALGPVPRCFSIDIFGTNRHSSHDIADNFSMFRRLLFHFAQTIEMKQPAIPPEDTLTSIRLLIAGRRAMKEQRTVEIDEISV